MDKYNKLLMLLQKSIDIMKSIKSDNKSTADFIVKYTDYLTITKEGVEKNDSPIFNGHLIGLSRWLGEWDEMDQYDDLWDVISQIEKLYKLKD